MALAARIVRGDGSDTGSGRFQGSVAEQDIRWRVDIPAGTQVRDGDLIPTAFQELARNRHRDLGPGGIGAITDAIPVQKWAGTAEDLLVVHLDDEGVQICELVVQPGQGERRRTAWPRIEPEAN